MKPTHKWINFLHCYSRSRELLERPYFPNQTKHSIKIHSVLSLHYTHFYVKNANMVPLSCNPNRFPQTCNQSFCCSVNMCIAADGALCSTHSKLDTSKGKSKSPLKADPAFQLQQRPELSWRLSVTLFGTVLRSRKYSHCKG